MDISPDEFRRCPKNPPCAFFLIQDGRHHVTPLKQGYTIIPHSRSSKKYLGVSTYV